MDENLNARTQIYTGVRTVAETITKLKANGFQYATAGDVRRLIDEIERLRISRKDD